MCRSKLVKKVGRAELYPYMQVGLQLMSRDFLLKAFGADCLIETGKSLVNDDNEELSKSMKNNHYNLRLSCTQRQDRDSRQVDHGPACERRGAMEVRGLVPQAHGSEGVPVHRGHFVAY